MAKKFCANCKFRNKEKITILFLKVGKPFLKELFLIKHIGCLQKRMKFGDSLKYFKLQNRPTLDLS